MTYITEEEIYKKYGLHCTTNRDFELYGTPLQYCICLKTSNLEQAIEKKKQYDEWIKQND